MAAATQSTPSTSSPSSQYGQAFSRITNVPLVAQSLSVAHSTLESHPLLSQSYHFGENVVSHGLKAAEPVTTRLQPQLNLLDSYAVKGLDFAESKFPYPFHATPEKVVKDARMPADQALAFVHAYLQAAQKTYDERVFGPAKSLYNAHVAPAYDSANAHFQELKSQNAYLQRAADIVGNLQTNLAKSIDALSTRSKADGDAAAQRAQGLSNAIFAELERLRNFATSLPAESRKRVSPVLDTFNGTYETLVKEARNAEVPPTQRFKNVLVFVREQTLPALQKALINPSAVTSSSAPSTPAVSTPATNGKGNAASVNGSSNKSTTAPKQPAAKPAAPKTSNATAVPKHA